jgi:hypothetical protein
LIVTYRFIHVVWEGGLWPAYVEVEDAGGGADGDDATD